MRLSEKLHAAGGRPSGFDYLRLGLALTVCVVHVIEAMDGREGFQLLWATPLTPFIKFILPAFFALSGFLVAGSLERSKTLFMFLGLRAIRIYPALIVDIVLCALLLGPAVTTLPLHAYFTDWRFFRYLLNISGEISFVLPGVFNNGPVNAQLWTIPFELYCYLSLSVLVLLGIRTRPATILYFIAITALAALGYGIFKYRDHFLAFEGPVSGLGLVTAFLTGVACYLYREKIAWSPRGAAIAAVVTYFASAFLPGIDFLVVIPMAYITVVIGLYDPHRLGLLKTADYSYGIYLYSCPIQQVLLLEVPGIAHWYYVVPGGILLTGLFAALSWTFVERPALNLRTTLKKLETRYLARKGRLGERPADVVHMTAATLNAQGEDVSSHRPPAREIPA